MTLQPSHLAIILMAAHFIGDWWMQPRAMALTKSSSIKVLTLHVFIITLTLAPVVCLFAPQRWPLLLVNAALHAFIDWNVWSGYKASVPHNQLATFRYWEDGRFYNTIAADQFMHLFLILLFFL
jgi:uncharacterized protein DUF3307